jgi:anti-repressor protein
MQKYIDNGYFELKLGSVVTPRGTRETFTTLITGKGQVALVQKIMGISKNK